MKEKISLADATSDSQLFDALVFGSPSGMALLGPSGMFIDANEAFQVISGYTKAELMSMTFQQITHQDDMLFDMQMFNEMLSGEISHYEMVKRFVKKTGDDVWVFVRVLVVRMRDGSVKGYIKHVYPVNTTTMGKGMLPKHLWNLFLNPFFVVVSLTLLLFGLVSSVFSWLHILGVVK